MRVIDPFWPAHARTVRALYRGILTQSGNPARVPWYVVTRCGYCDTLQLASIKHAPAERFRCSSREHRAGQGKGPYPDTVRCGHVKTIVDIPDFEEVCGISYESAQVAFETWHTKYA